MDYLKISGALSISDPDIKPADIMGNMGQVLKKNLVKLIIETDQSIIENTTILVNEVSEVEMKTDSNIIKTTRDINKLI